MAHQWERRSNAKHEISSRFPLIRFAASYPVAAGYRYNRGYMATAAFHLLGCNMHKPLFLNPIERNSPQRSEDYKQKRD